MPLEFKKDNDDPLWCTKFVKWGLNMQRICTTTDLVVQQLSII